MIAIKCLFDWGSDMNEKKKSDEDFSFDGTLSRLGYIGFFWLFSTINGFFMDNVIMLLLLSPVQFYTTLVMMQKRCRDFNYNGTIFILIYSVLELFGYCFLYMRFYKDYKEQVKNILSQHEYIGSLWISVFVVHIISLILLVLIPGKKEKDLTLRSPLLKYPWRYMGGCYSIYIICVGVFIYWHRIYYLG